MYEYEDRVAMATNKAKTSFRATTVAMTTVISSISTTIYLHIRDIVYTKGRKITPKCFEYQNQNMSDWTIEHGNIKINEMMRRNMYINITMQCSNEWNQTMEEGGWENFRVLDAKSRNNVPGRCTFCRRRRDSLARCDARASDRDVIVRAGATRRTRWHSENGRAGSDRIKSITVLP